MDAIDITILRSKIQSLCKNDALFTEIDKIFWDYGINIDISNWKSWFTKEQIDKWKCRAMKWIVEDDEYDSEVAKIYPKYVRHEYNGCIIDPFYDMIECLNNEQKRAIYLDKITEKDILDFFFE